MPQPVPAPFFAHAAASEPQHFRIVRDLDTGRVLGFIVATRHPGAEGHVLLLAIDPAHRNEGLRQALLRGLQESLRADGEHAFAVEVPRMQDETVDFFRRQGYALVGIEPGTAGRETSVLMQKRLEQGRG